MPHQKGALYVLGIMQAVKIAAFPAGIEEVSGAESRILTGASSFVVSRRAFQGLTETAAGDCALFLLP